jgi:signal transduction histidine kinase/CheY-like chemotaxis protein
MKLRTRLYLFSMLPLVVAAAALLVLFLISQPRTVSFASLDNSTALLNAAAELHSATFATITEETKGEHDWIRKHEAVTRILTEMRAGDRTGAPMLGHLLGSAERMKQIFDRINSGALRKADLTTSRLELSYSSQSLVSEAALLGHEKRLATDSARQMFRIMLMIVAVAVASAAIAPAFYLANSLLRKKQSLAPHVADKLQSGFRIVGQGDLQYRLKTGSDDDAARVFNEFNRLVAKFHEKTKEQQKQMDASKRMADAARQTTSLLSGSLVELRRTQTQIIREERMSALEQVIAGITHDFNSALTPILNTADFLLTYPDKLSNREQVTELLEAIREGAKEARDQVNNLAQFFRPARVSDAVPLDLRESVRAAIELTRPMWKPASEAKGIQIVCVPDLKQVAPVKGVEQDLIDAFSGLILNAIEAMPESGKLTVSTRMHNGQPTVEIRDTGTGMTEEVKNRCEEPFFTTRGEERSGLGLSLAVARMAQFGGELRIKSRVGKGTTVTIEFPACDEPIHTPETPTATIISAWENLHVLVVDDEATARDVLARTLSAEGHTVTTACCGEEGFQKLKAGQFEVVFLDKAMPDMDGEQLAARIKQYDPVLAVVLCTGFGSLMDHSDRLPEGIDFILNKPATVEEIRSAVATSVAAVKIGASPSH